MADDSNFPLTMAMGGYDPTLAYQPLLKRYQDRAAQPVKDPLTPEEVAQRRGANQQAQNIAMLSMLSGDEQLQNFGGQIFKQALADKQTKVTDRGTYDPLSQKWTLDPTYQREQSQGDLDKVYGQIAQAQAGEIGRRETQADALARMAQENRYATAREAAARSAAQANLPPTIVIDPATGQPKYVERANAIGQTPFIPSLAGGGGSEDQNKAAGWTMQAQNALTTMHDSLARDPEAAKPGFFETAAKKFGQPGEDVAYASMSPQRQRFTTAASSFSEAVLRAATGAGVNYQEAVQKVNELTPRWGESQEAIDDKAGRTDMYLQSLALRAGRALPANQRPGAAGGGAGLGSDPLSLRGSGMSGRRPPAAAAPARFAAPTSPAGDPLGLSPGD